MIPHFYDYDQIVAMLAAAKTARTVLQSSRLDHESYSKPSMILGEMPHRNKQATLTHPQTVMFGHSGKGNITAEICS